jgi:L-ribulose-5-phosphate 3-epimerase UlaE
MLTPPKGVCSKLLTLSGTRLYGPALGSQHGTEREEETWLALAAITLAAAIGFNVLALAI